jgi:hypothetical protein
MKGSAMLAGQACALALAAMMTTPGVAQEKALTLAGQNFILQRTEQSQRTEPLEARSESEARAGGHRADPNTGVAVFGPSGRGTRSAWLVFGGTSVAAPLIAGLYGVNDTAVSHGADPYNHVANLHDVTSGSNGKCTVAYLCTAVAGYDGPTGLGTPNGVAAFGL